MVKVEKFNITVTDEPNKKTITQTEWQQFLEKLKSHKSLKCFEYVPLSLLMI
jgi:hypothetical protein